MDYKTAWNKFIDELLAHPSVIKASEHYNLTPDIIIRTIKPRISVNYYRNKSVKLIKINTTDPSTGINIKHSNKY